VSPAANDQFTGRVIEYAWLFAIAAVPLAFSGPNWFTWFTEPKQYVLHLAALTIAVAWTTEAALAGAGRYQRSTRVGWSLIGWAGKSPAKWAVAAAVALVFWQVLSTLTSPLPAFSFFGRDPNNPGGDLYSTLSLAVIFLAVALRLRTRGQLLRVLWTLAAVGAGASLYGVAQYFGWDPFGYGAAGDRVFATFGNPIYFGSYLVMSIGSTLALFAMRRGSERPWHSPLVLLLLALQIAGLWFTDSRGPWLGAVALLGGIAVAGAIWFDRRSLFLAALGAGVAVLTAVLVSIVPASASADESRGVNVVRSAITEIQNFEIVPASSSPGAASPVETTTPPAPVDAASAVTPAPSGRLPTTFESRVAVWRASLNLALNWSWEPRETGVARIIRPLLGYGPEMAYYAFPLELNPQFELLTYSNAHNFLLQALLETGWVGLLLLLLVLILSAIAAVQALMRLTGSGRSGDWRAVAVAAISATIVARIVEQSTGLARLGDLVTFWVLLGALLALCINAAGPGLAADAVAQQPRRSRAAGQASASSLVAPAVAIAVFIGAVALFLAVDVRAVTASRTGALALADVDSQRFQSAYNRFKGASETNPGSEIYALAASARLASSARIEEDLERSLATYYRSRQFLTDFAARNPFEYRTQMRMAIVEASIAARGDERVLPDFIDRLNRIARQLPPYPQVQAFVAHGLAISGDYDAAVAASDRAIAMEAVASPQIRGQAWWSRGEALLGLGRTDEAVLAFETAIDRDRSAYFELQAHNSLVRLYEALGDTAKAEVHRKRALEITGGA
jgi:O-antigen ligase